MDQFTAPIIERDEAAPVEALPRIEILVDPVEALVGDLIQVHLELIHVQYAHVEVLYQQASWGELEILETTPGAFETLPDGRIRRTLNFTIAAYSTGDFSIPSLPILTAVEGMETQLLTPPVKIHIRSLLPDDLDETALRDIKPQERLFGENLAGYLFLAIALLTLLLLAAYLLYRRMRRHRESEGPPPLPAHTRALEALHTLRQERDLFERRQVEIFSIRVSEILRIYILEKFGVPALDYTSAEILSTVEAIQEEIGLASETKQHLETFFEECDLIKFARHELAEEGMYALIDIAEAWVRATCQPVGNRSAERISESAPEEETAAEKMRDSNEK